MEWGQWPHKRFSLNTALHATDKRLFEHWSGISVDLTGNMFRLRPYKKSLFQSPLSGLVADEDVCMGPGLVARCSSSGSFKL
jgi:hypothetical protein